MAEIKLYAFLPTEYGYESYIVAAVSEADARKSVEDYIKAQDLEEDYRDAEYYLGLLKDTDTYRVQVYEPGQVMTHAND